jgi:uncharacterized membrane protein
MAHSPKRSLLYEPNFNWRATEVSRLEGFSDAVFAFAVTLLVVSLEVPKNFGELLGVMKGFVAFGICFAMLALVWKEHTVFFRRYGLLTAPIVTLNSALLFVVLLYVYPLKFLFGMIVGEFSGGRLSATPAEPGITQHQIPALMVMYGLGFAAVYLLLALMYRYAYKRRAELELNEVEVFMTRRSILDHAAMTGIGVFASALALLLPEHIAGLSGMSYWLVPVYYTVSGFTLGSRERRLAERQLQQVNSRAVHAQND